MNNEAIIFAQQFEKIRASQRKSKAELAKLIGRDASDVSRFLSGHKHPDWFFLNRLRTVFKVSAEYFFLNIPLQREKKMQKINRLLHKLSFLPDDKFKEIEKKVNQELFNMMQIEAEQPIQEVYNPNKPNSIIQSLLEDDRF